MIFIVVVTAFLAYLNIGSSDIKGSVENMNTNNIDSLIDESEILSGGPGKDGIPSIDNPQFVSLAEANFLNDDDIGLGLVVDGDVRFYPYQILVWHEIVNDIIAGVPVAVTYCPLCRTGVVYNRRVDGEVLEFGVSGKLWQSNLLMYDRNSNTDAESLWSQVLGTAVVGPRSGQKLKIVRSDTVRFGDWKKEYPNTKILSKETGVLRAYGTDPYGSYYESEDVSFGANFSDGRLHPKEFVLGIEVKGEFKAYPLGELNVGVTVDSFAGSEILIEKSSIDEVVIKDKNTGEHVPHIGSFWFAWLAVHPTTELYKK